MATYTFDKKAIMNLIGNEVHKSGYDRDYALQTASLVQRKLMKFATEKIRDFYGDYTPLDYQRTGNLYNAIRPYMEDHGSYIEAGIQFSADFMNEYSDPNIRGGIPRGEGDYHFLYTYPHKHIGRKKSDIRRYDVREPVLVNTLLWGVHGNSKWMWAKNAPTSPSAFLLTEAYAQSASFLSSVGLI